MSRREVFSNSAKALFAGLATPFVLDPTDPANALLLRFPIGAYNTQPLKNTYHFLRAGTSDLEVDGIYSTNPLFLTNRENGLSPQGYESLKKTADILKKTPLSPTVAYHSLAANGMDTGDYLARELKLGRDRLLPEFTYLDQRGIGLWDSSDETVVRHAVWAMDSLEAGSEGFGGRPPANTDGTPNDTLHDQFTRLRQFLSLQETRTSGDIILVIFPDGTGPALLSCMIAGIPYSEVHTLEYKPGELRLDITPESIRELYESRKDDPAYLATIEEGTQQLKELREMKAQDFSVSFKDSKADEKQEAESRAYYEKQRIAAAQKQKEDEERRAAVQEQLRLSKEKEQAKKEQRKQEELAIKEKKDKKLREEKEKAEKKKAEGQAAYVANKQKQAEIQAAPRQKQAETQAASKQKYAESQALKKQKQIDAAEKYAEAQAAKKEKLAAAVAAAASKSGGTSSNPSESSLPFGLSPAVLATTAFGAIGAAFFAGMDDEDQNERNDLSAIATKKDNSGDDGNASRTASISAAVQEDKPETETQTTSPVVISKNLHHVQAAHVSSLPFYSTEVQSEINEIPVVANVTAKTTSISAAVQEEIPDTQIAAPVTSDKKEEKKRRKTKLKPLHSSRKKDDSVDDDDNAVKKATSNSEFVKVKKTKLKPLHSSVSTKEDESVTSGRVVDASSKTEDDGKDDEESVLTTIPNNDADVEEEFTTKLQAAEQEMKDAFVEAADVKKKKEQQHRQSQAPKKRSSLFDNDPPVIVTKQITKTTNFVYEDDEDDSDWLRILSEIRSEKNDDDDEDDFGAVDYASLANDSQY